MPATQYGFAVEAANTSGLPDVFYHQRVNDNTGASFSPFVGSPASSQHSSSTMGPKLGGSLLRKKTKQTKQTKKAKKTKTRKDKKRQPR
jgi:hypothetical protein